MEDRPIRVLLIEANPEDVRSMQEMLAKASAARFELECVDRLAAGLVRLATNNIGVLLLGLDLPDSQGFDAFAKAYAQAPRVPIIVMGNRADEDLAMKTVQEGAQDYLVKGQITSDLLARAIRYAIERKRAEEALHSQALIFDNIHDSIIMTDLTGNIMRWNPAAERMFGYVKDEISCKTLDVLTTRIINGKLRDGRWAGEMNFTRKDGTEVVCETAVIPLCDARGTITAVCGVSHDITKHKQAEEALRKSEEKYRSIVENIQEGYFENDLVGNFTFVNDALCSLIGYPREELIGKNNRLYTDEETAKKIYQIYNRIYRTGEPSKGVEEEYIRKDGTKLFAELSVSLIRDAEGKPIGFRGIARDVTERKQAEAALRESESQVRKLFEAIPDSILVHDDEGTILHINEIGAERLEWSAKDLVGRNLREIVTPESRASIADHIRETHEVGWCRFETTYVSRSGWQIVAEVYDRPIKFGKAKAILRVARDITDRKEAEKALEREKNFSNAIINSSPGLMFVFGEKGNIIQWNSNAENVTGYSASEIAKMNIIDFVPEEDTKTAAEAAQEALTKGQASVEINILSKPGKKIPFYITGRRTKIENANCVVCTGIDITERKQAEEKLRESEEKYRDLVENISDILYTTDENGIITYIAPPIELLSGYAPSEIIGHPFSEFVHEEDIPYMRDKFEQDLSGRAEPHEYRAVNKEGAVRWVRVSSRPFFQETRVIGVRGILTDITERKQAEEEVKRSYEQLHETLISTVNALASTVEMRDRYTAGHQPRVTQLACVIAKEMGLSAGQIEGIRMAASIHDIGKIMVPTEILSKPGPLTELQFEMIKMHPQAGYDILKGIQFPWPVAEIVLQHHERLNGSGYPQGLKDGEIMLEAKILAVADVVEAMASHRPYRPALGTEAALHEIIMNKGILYDPDVTDICARLFTVKGFVLGQEI